MFYSFISSLKFTSSWCNCWKCDTIEIWVCYFKGGLSLALCPGEYLHTQVPFFLPYQLSTCLSGSWEWATGTTWWPVCWHMGFYVCWLNHSRKTSQEHSWDESKGHAWEWWGPTHASEAIPIDPTFTFPPDCCQNQLFHSLTLFQIPARVICNT